MNWWESIVMGIVQGLTEFLPVSSSGHLVIARDLLGVEAPEDLVFEAFVHTATVLSTIVVFRKQIWALLKGLWLCVRALCGKRQPGIPVYNDETDYVCKILVSLIPIFVVGMFFKDQVTELFGSIYSVAGALIVTAILLFFSDYASRRKQTAGEAPALGRGNYRNGISWWQAIVVGLGQAVAVVPGLSRSGTTISTGLICGVKRDVVAQFSFLMVIIPILGNTFLDLVGGEFASSTIGWLPLLLGFVSAFVTGLFACKAMIALVKRAKLSWFALYCLIVSVLIFIFA